MSKRKEKGFLLGIGLDNADGHRRITRSEDFVVTGGSKETHERLSEHAIKISEEVKKRGKDVSELHHEEFREIVEKTRS
jgi:hypothetical protein